MKSFVKQLMSLVKLAQLKPNETHVFQVEASFGNYEVLVGPLSTQEESDHNLPIEINGELHHLVVSPEGIAPHPSHQQVQNHLKDCVIIRNMMLHLKDPTGSGETLENKNGRQVLYIKDNINIAGSKGVEHLKTVTQSGALAEAAYQIIQEDILKALARLDRNA